MTQDQVVIHRMADGCANCSVNGSWISAIFTSPEAARSWDGHWDQAEKEFAALNPPTGKGPNSLGPRPALTVKDGGAAS